MTRHLTRIALVGAAALLLASSTFASAAPLSVSAAPSRVAPGGSVTLRYVVKRPPAKLVVKLDRKRLRVLRVRKARGRVAIRLPRSIAPGPHRLTVCLGKACRSVSVHVTKSQAPSGPAQAPQPPATPEPAAAPAPGPSSPEPESSPPAVDFTGPANPLDVEAHTDQERRATKLITVAGGTLTTTGADGTHYKLTVPAGALLSDKEISMTPISSVDGLPYAGGLAYGVQLEPSGLRFMDFVTVEISGHPPVSAQEETGFLYQQSGDELQLYPVAEDASKTTFKILHFSGVGVAKGTQAERNEQLLRATTDVEGRLMQQFEGLFRQGQAFDEERAREILRAFHDQSVKPLVTAALTDDGLATQALNRYFGWERYIALLFAGEPEFMTAERATLQDQIVEVVKNAGVAAHRHCVEENKPEMMPMLLGWWRVLALLSDKEMPTDLWTAFSTCARFELDFHTKVVQEQGIEAEGPELWKGEAIAENVILTPDRHSLQVSGIKGAQYVDFRVDIPPHKPGTGCWHGGDEWENEFPLYASRLQVDINPVQRTNGTYGYPDFERGKIKLSIVPFQTLEHWITVDCNGSGGGVWANWLGTTFYELHEDQLDDFGGMVFTDWTVPTGGGSMLGAKTYFRTKNLGGYRTREETTLELYHAPVQ